MNESKQGSDAENMGELEQKMSHPQHHTLPTLLVIGTETALFDKNSSVRRRVFSYAAAFREMHVIVLCDKGYAPERSGNVTLYPTNSRSRLARLIDGLRLARSLKDIDIVTVQDPFETGLVGWRAARALSAALHVQVHTDFFAPAFTSLSFSNRLRKACAGFVLRRAARIRVVSMSLKHKIRERYHVVVPVSVLPIFVDVERFARAEPNPALLQRFARFPTRILVVSRLESEKNILLTITAFAKIAPEGTCLIVLGEGSEREYLEHCAKDLGVSARVFFEDVRDPAGYYKLSDLVLFPSAYDGYGLVIIEALAAGKPVLSTDVGIAREAGAIVTTPEKFAESLSEWFKNGPREGHLESYPYKDFDEYVRAYCDDIVAAA